MYSITTFTSMVSWFKGTKSTINGRQLSKNFSSVNCCTLTKFNQLHNVINAQKIDQNVIKCWGNNASKYGDEVFPVYEWTKGMLANKGQRFKVQMSVWSIKTNLNIVYSTESFILYFAQSLSNEKTYANWNLNVVLLTTSVMGYNNY